MCGCFIVVLVFYTLNCDFRTYYCDIGTGFEAVFERLVYTFAAGKILKLYNHE